MKKCLLSLLVGLFMQDCLAVEENNDPELVANVQHDQLYSFDSRSLFGGASQDIDLSNYTKGSLVSSGMYSVSISVNDRYLGQKLIKFEDLSASLNADLCVNDVVLNLLDLKKTVLDRLDKKECLTIKDLDSEAYYDFNRNELSLDISLPLSITNNRPAGYIAPELFDKGVNSAYLSYDFNTYKYKYDDQEDSVSNYLSLSAGLNILGFNYRHEGNFDSNGNKFNNYHSYLNVLSTDITPLDARLMMGDFNTQTYSLDSAQVRGIQLATDTSMRPMSQRSYAPLIQGIANTNALVSVFQSGRKIYERTVPAGKFEINDLTAISSNGNLTVQVTENGGEKHSFIVPLQGNMNLIRVGQLNFSAAAGQYKINRKTTDDYIGQLSFEYGLSNYLSMFAGVNASSPFQSYLLGMGVNSAVGGFKLDGEYAQATLNNKEYSGGKYQISYQFNYAPSNTSFTLRNISQSKEFMSLVNTMSLSNYDELDTAEIENLFQTYRLKNGFDISLYQSFKDSKWGALSLNLTRNTYWNTKDDYTQYSLGYSNSIGKLSYSLGVSKTANSVLNNASDKRVYLTLSLPLEWRSLNKRASLTSNIQHTSNINNITTAYAGVSGTFGEYNQASYSLVANNAWNNSGMDTNSLSASLGYNLPQVQVGSVIGYGNNYSQYGFSARGAVVAHPYGLTLTNSVSDTYTIIHAKDAQGAVVNNAWGVKIDRFGNGIYSNLTPYEVNEISLDTKVLPVDVHLKSNQSQIIPRRYSATLIDFKTEKTSNILLNVKVKDQAQIPIGVQVIGGNEQLIGVFGQSNQFFVENPSLLKESFVVQWGAQQPQQCQVQVPSELLKAGKYNSKNFKIVDVECN